MDGIAHGVEPGFNECAISLIHHRTTAPAIFPKGVDGREFIRVKRHARVNFGGGNTRRDQVPIEGCFEAPRLLRISGILILRG